MQDDIKNVTWVSPKGTCVVFPWDLEKYIFTPSEFVRFKQWMHGKTCMMVGHGSAYYPDDIMKFAKEQAEVPVE